MESPPPAAPLNITGELIALGPLRRELLPLYWRWVNDLGTLRGLGLPPQGLTMEQESAWYDDAARQLNACAFTIYELASERPIGTTSLKEINYRNGTATFGLLIGEADARGKGYGTEATRLMLDVAFTALGLRNVMLTVFSFNLAAQRAYQRAGFREFGRRRRCAFMGGQLWDVVYMDCLASEFTSPVLSRILVPDEPRPTTSS